ncbi:CLUMA_CG002558, isoform A, partial [Clunio marinus]
LVSRHQRLWLHRISYETKRLPSNISDVTALDNFQYFSMKIKDLMDKEQLEYFDNVLKKVVNIQHPVADLMNDKLHSPILDLIMMLITNVVNIDADDSDIKKKQKTLANVIQLIHIGSLVHQKGIVDLHATENFGNDLPEDHDLIMGNKMALLAGDFLLANAQIKVTQMRNDALLLLISSAIRDIIDSNFIGNYDGNCNPLPFKPGQTPVIINTKFLREWEPIRVEGKSGNAEDEWMMRNLSNRGFLAAKGCQGLGILAKKSQEVQEKCFELGKHLYLTWKVFTELEPYRSRNVAESFEVNVTSAPFLFHLHENPKMFEIIRRDLYSLQDITDNKLYNVILNGPGVESTEKLLKRLVNQTQRKIQNFPDSNERRKIEETLSAFV